MEMFGGLTKTSSRIAIAAALGTMLGGYALSTPAKAGDLGGDCCADLEERVAELEATTVRKGNKKVSVTLSGWVVKSINWWDDGFNGGFAVGDKDYDLGSRFAITGSATIAPGWSGGYNITVTTGGTAFGIAANGVDEYNSVNGLFYGSSFSHINTLYSYGYIKSDTYGTLNWGHLSPASDNPAVLADASGTVIESNFVGFEGAGFGLFAAGAPTGLSWASFWQCNSGAAPGADCFGTAQPAVRYDSPTWGGFRFETSYGTYDVLPALLDTLGVPNHPTTQKSNFWDGAVFYNGDWWTNWKVTAAYAFTWLESNPFSGGEEKIHQVGGTVLHSPSGLGIYAMAEWELMDAAGNNRCPGSTANPTVTVATPTGGTAQVVGAPVTTPGCLTAGTQLRDTQMWGVKPFIQGNWWNGVGKTIFFGEYAQYEDFGRTYSGAGINALPVCATNLGAATCLVTGSDMDRWGLGVVQEIDAAAMHLWLRWQHQELDVGLVDTATGNRGTQGFDDFNLFQAGGIWFF
jgi:hypothetical protein